MCKENDNKENRYSSCFVASFIANVICVRAFGTTVYCLLGISLLFFLEVKSECLFVGLFVLMLVLVWFGYIVNVLPFAITMEFPKKYTQTVM